MRSPRLSDFGITQEDLEWASSTERRILFALLIASALAWGLYGWLTAKPMHPLLAIRTIIVGFCLAYLTAFVFFVSAKSFLYLATLRYRRARQYKSANKKFRTRRLRAQPHFQASQRAGGAQPGLGRDKDDGKQVREPQPENIDPLPVVQITDGHQHQADDDYGGMQRERGIR